MRSDFDHNGQVKRRPRVRHPSILYREYGLMESDELKAAERYFVTHKSRMVTHGGDLVIGRYSVLPYYKELEDDLRSKDSVLINSYAQHRYVANLANYVVDLGDMTFRTWNANNFPEIPDGIALVLKGETNSKKDLWKTHMFAENKAEAIEVYMNLMRDNMISQQDIYAREYIPLRKLCDAITGPPVTMEFRFFVAYGEVVSGGFYWSSHVDDLESIPSPSLVPQEFLQRAIDRVKDNVNFFVIDVAQTESGDWIVVELNDGQMSGLSENDPEILYRNLKRMTWDRYKE